uniref:helix-turn-helix domain-containing protein n=1 Tax=Cupriavidus necator TaxID=106590 RepID=UPI003F4911F6
MLRGLPCIRERCSRLAEEGTNFETLRGEVRTALALHYLRGTKLAVGQISLMLGFPAQSALSRACRQWFALTPSDVRGFEQRDFSACDREAKG